MKKDDKFVNLHSHTTYSLLDGYGTPEKMVQRAAELGQVAFGVTEHGNMSSVLDVNIACQKHGIKHIIGNEFYLVPFGSSVSYKPKERRDSSYHLTCLAYNQVGYQNLLKLTSLSNDETSHHYNPRIDLNMLEQYNEGLIITSGCMGSYVCQGFIGYETNGEQTEQVFRHTNESTRRVHNFFSWAMDVFGLDRFFVELQDHDMGIIRKINKELHIINDKYFQFDYLVTNDAHYSVPGEVDGHTALIAINSGCTLINPNRFVENYSSHPVYYLTDYDHMIAKNYGFDVPDAAFTNTVKIADMVEDIKLGYEPEVKKYRFPIMPEYSHDYHDELEKIAGAGFREIYGPLAGTDRYYEALERFAYELEIINKLGFSSYFLCIYDISRYCIEEGIPMTVRGSAGGSIVLYCLQVTDFCPLKYNLLFERFLNQDRVSAPDADFDIDPERRHQVIKYIVDKYGKDKTAQVATFNYIKGRGAIRDAIRLLELPYSVGDAFVVMLEKIEAEKKKQKELGEDYDDDYDPSTDSITNYSDDVTITTDQEQNVWNTAISLQGQIRTYGLHAGALMVSDRSLDIDYPMIRPKSSSKALTKKIVGMSYKKAEKIGGIKLDLLNVEALGILYHAIKTINSRHGTEYTFQNIPTDDQRSYDLINSGRLAEIFQISGYTARVVAKQIQPQTVEDVMAINAISRPGPLKYAQIYADRLHGKKPVEYKHPDLESILSSTQSVIIYQEQLMEISRVIAGFSGSDADYFRKAISDKNEETVGSIGKLFRDAAIENGYDIDFVNSLWLDLYEFRQYGFNASHACAYSRVAVKQAYLKALYPIEYYSAAMTGRAKKDEKLAELLKEMSLSGIKLLPVQVGKSEAYSFMIDDEANGIRYPYRAVKNVGKAGLYLQDIGEIGSHQTITEEQLKKFKRAGSRALNSLALVGALDHIFDGDRNRAVEGAKWLAQGHHFIHQLSIEEDAPQYSHIDFLRIEKELTGTYMSGHPLDGMPENKISFADQHLYERMHGEIVFLTGVVSRIREHRQRDSRLMVFFELEDRDYNMMKFVMFADQYSTWSRHITLGNPLRIIAEIDVRYGRTEEEEEKAKKYGRVSAKVKTVIGVDYAKQK